MQINLNAVPAAGATGVSVTESLAGQTGYSILGRACQTGSYPTAAQAIAAGNAAAVTVGTGTVQRQQDWYCTYVNGQNTGSVHVRKLIGGTQTGGWTVGASVPGGANSARFTPGNTTSASGSTDPSSDLVFNLTAIPSSGGVPVSLAETAQTGYSFGTFTCKLSSYAGTTVSVTSAALGGTFTVLTGQDVFCTFTNTRDTGTVTVIKHWVGGATGETPGVDLNISGPSSSTTHVAGLADGSTGAKSGGDRHLFGD